MLHWGAATASRCLSFRPSSKEDTSILASKKSRGHYSKGGGKKQKPR
jgi:hypothetical protein